LILSLNFTFEQGSSAAPIYTPGAKNILKKEAEVMKKGHNRRLRKALHAATDRSPESMLSVLLRPRE